MADDKHEVKPEHLVEAIDLVMWELENAKPQQGKDKRKNKDDG